MKKYDAIVIGAGAGGLVVAFGAAALGKKVLLIEKNKIGGDCTHYGCIPSKTLIKSAHVAHTIRNAKRWGITAKKPKISWKKIRKHIQDTIDGIYEHETPEAIKEQGIDVEIGAARFINERTVAVNGKDYRGKRIIIATGARPRTISIPGLESYHTNETIFRMKKQPKTLAILGGGPIGCELGQAFARLGTEVHIISQDGLLPREDADVQEHLREVFQEEGINVHTGTIKKVSKQRKKKRLHLTNKTTVDVDEVLVSIGRIPNSEGLGLEEVGISVDERGRIETDGKMRTNQKHVYAVGDCTSKYQFTHAAEQQGRATITNAFLPVLRKSEEELMPWVTYTDPEVAHVGPTEEELKGEKYRLYQYDFSDNDRAKTEHDTKGFVKLYTKPFSGKILAATIVGARAGELINEVTLAIKTGESVKTLSGMIHPYPTRSQAIRGASDKWYKEYLPELLGRK